MGQHVRGVVSREKGAPVSLETIVVPDPGPGEALVAVKACGVCHTRPALPRGRHQRRLPLPSRPRGGRRRRGGRTGRGRPLARRLRRPELAGRLRGVPGLPPGPALVLLLDPQRHAEDDPGRRHAALPALGIGAFAEKTLVAAGQCTKVDPAARPEAVGLLGCGVMAGLGAAMFTGQVGPGDSVAVFGCGGVGCAAVAGAKLAGAATVIGVDLDPRKLELATSFGATHTVDASPTDPVEAIRSLTGGNGADVCIEAVGHPAVMEQAFFARDLAGILVQVGVPTPDMRIDIPMIEFFGAGRAEAELVRRLPPLARLPGARRPLPPGAPRPRPLRERDHRHRRRRGRLRSHATRRGAALRRGPLTSP